MMVNIDVFVANNAASDMVYNHLANLKVKGVAKKQGIRIPCRVRLYERSSGRLIGDTLTDDDGNYEFNNLNNLRFFLVAHDPSSQFNAVIQDNVVPK